MSPDRSPRRGPKKTCSIDGCGLGVRSGGLCWFHHDRKKEYGNPLAGPPRPVKFRRDVPCSVPGCERMAKHLGWCDPHYQRNKKYDSPTGGPAPRVKNPKASCSVPTCSLPVKANGMCGLHYQRDYNFGDPLATRYADMPRVRARPGEPMAFLLAAAESDTDECIEWPYSVSAGGYGIVRVDGRNRAAHRMVLQLTAGEPPEEGMYACHAPSICHTRRCINPRHLRWDTPTANKADTAIDGTKNQGERCGAGAKLTEADIHQIRHVDQRPDYELSLVYGCTPGNIYAIRNYLSWKHLP